MTNNAAIYLILFTLLIACGSGSNEQNNNENPITEIPEKEEIVPDKAFLEFVESFPVLTEINISKEQADAILKQNFKTIPVDMVLKYIYRVDVSNMEQTKKAVFADSINLPRNFVSKDDKIYNYVPVEGMLKGEIPFLAVGRIDLSKNFKSIIIIHNGMTNEGSLLGLYYMLINYKLNGEPISYTNLADAERYMSYRIHEGVLKDNVLKITELDYNAGNGYVLGKKSNYVSEDYFRLLENGTFKNIRREFYPYAFRVYESKAGDKYHFDQNKDYFDVLYSKSGESVSSGIKILEKNLEENRLLVEKDAKTFTIEVAKDMSKIMVKSPDGVAVEYVEKKR